MRRDAHHVAGSSGRAPRKRRGLVGSSRASAQGGHLLILESGAFAVKSTLPNGSNAQRKVTADGLETTFVTNHLSPFLLTNLLLPVLKASAPARIVNVSTGLHRSAHIDFDDLQSERDYDQRHAYGQAKLANLFFTYALARRLRGTTVTVNAADPLATKRGANAMPSSLPLAIRLILPLLKPFLTTGRAAQSSIYLASSPAVEGLTGAYVNVWRKSIRSSPASYDEATAEKVRRVSIELTGLEEKSLSH